MEYFSYLLQIKIAQNNHYNRLQQDEKTAVWKNRVYLTKAWKVICSVAVFNTAEIVLFLAL